MDCAQRHPFKRIGFSGQSRRLAVYCGLLVGNCPEVSPQRLFYPQPLKPRSMPPSVVLSLTLIHLQHGRNIVNNNKSQSLQDPFLNQLRREHVPVSVYLVNGIKLQGQIESFDQYVVLLRNTVTQMVYKHAISTIVPGRPVNFQMQADEDADAPEAADKAE